MTSLRNQIDAAIAWFEARASRERWILMLGAGTTVYAVFALTLLNPLLQKREDLAHGLKAIESELTELQARASGTATAASQNRRMTFEQRIAVLDQELSRLDANLAKEHASLVPPKEARRVLEELLSKEAGLRLVRLEALPPRPFYEVEEENEDPTAKDSEPEEGQILYRHDLRLEASGEYFSTLHYLRALEAGGHGIVLDELKYEVEDHPRARIIVQVYTLSFDRSWIGV